MPVEAERYTVLDEIGHGGMATVYRARDTMLDREVAIKVLHPHLQRTAEARERFTREAKSVARLRHPNILEIFDYSGERSDRTFIATELLTGPTLKDYVVEHNDVPAEIAACIALQLAEALSQAHGAGIIHRDVKPENVLLHEDRCVKLTDFGIAHLADTHTFTATGQVLGSPGHMAPEQVETGHCDARSDVFSLGTVLYFVAVGRLPFVGRNAHHLLKQLLGGEYPDPLRLRPTIGGQLKTVIDKSLALDPDDRYQDALAFAHALRGFLEELGVDDPNQLLQSYLSDPATTREALRVQSVDALLKTAALSTRDSDVPRAHVALNRVLALDDGNDRALKLLASLGRRGTMRRRLAVAVALVGMGVFGAIGYAAWGTEQDVPGTVSQDPPPPVVEPPDPTVDAIADVPLQQDGAASDDPDTESASDASPGDTGPEVPPAPQTTTPKPMDRSPRLVVFKPTPSNVTIGVDGGPAKPWGPSFRNAKLTPGTHTITVVGGENCCKPWKKRIRVPAGSGAYNLPIKLEYQPARLYLAGAAPPDATVRVVLPGGRSRRGKIREIFSVPVRALESQAQLIIKAAGYETYRGRVGLRAGGDLSTHRFTLEPSSETP